MDACKTTVEAQGILLTLSVEDAEALVAWVEATAETTEEEDGLILAFAETLETALAEEEEEAGEDGEDDS